MRSDGWEWEGSTYYHVFVLRAYLLGLRGIDPSTVPSDVAATLGSMMDVLAAIAAPNGFLPALHDGPYDRAAMHREVLEICVLGRQFFSATALAKVEEWVRARLGPEHDGLEDLLAGWFPSPRARHEVPQSPSILFDQVGYAVLSDPAGRLTAVLDAGPHGGAHGHLDKLGLYLYGRDAAVQPAPGVPPYASALRHGYYARTIAHPTVRVDGADQTEATATITRWDPAAGFVSAESLEAVPGGRLTRTLRLEDGLLIDIVRVQMHDGAEHSITLGLRPAVAFEVRALDGGWISRWGAETASALVGLHRATAPSALEVLPGRGPSVDPSAHQLVGEWTASAASVDFVSLYCFDQNTLPTAFEIVRSDAEGTSLRVQYEGSESTTIEVHR